MRMKLVAVLLLAMPVMADTPKLKPNYKVTRMSVQDVAVSCLNGQPPETKQIGHAIVVSCDAQ